MILIIMTWNVQRPGHPQLWNLPCYEKQHFRGDNRFMTQIWFIQEAAMANGSSAYVTQNKEAEGHRFYYNELNINDTMITVATEFVDTTQKTIQRQAKHCLMLKVGPRTRSSFSGTATCPKAGVPSSALDELEAMDKMLKDIAEDGKAPTATYIGGDWNANMTRSATESHENRTDRGERAETVAYYVNKWGVARAATTAPEEET